MFGLTKFVDGRSLVGGVLLIVTVSLIAFAFTDVICIASGSRGQAKVLSQVSQDLGKVGGLPNNVKGGGFKDF